MNQPLDRSKVTPSGVRSKLNKSNYSNIAVAREIRVPIRNVRAFRKGDDSALSKLEQIKVLTLIKRGTF